MFDYIRRESWSFDFSSETWSRIASIPQEAGGYLGFSFSVGDKGYMGGGTTNFRYSGDSSPFVIEYDPITNKWTKKDNILEPFIRSATGYVSDGKKGYIFCGHTHEQSFNVGSNKFLQFLP